MNLDVQNKKQIDSIPTPKTCFNCHNRVSIAEGYRKRNILLRIIGIPIVYIPFLMGSWVLLFFLGFCSYLHLRIVSGNIKIKKLKDFLPESKSHRYTYKTQIVMGHPLSLNHRKLFWIFNCTWYCPISVGVLEWMVYLIKIKQKKTKGLVLQIIEFLFDVILFPFFVFCWFYFVLIGSICYVHLRLLGSNKSLKNLSSYFLISRQKYKLPLMKGWYCLLTICLLEWCCYLVKVVEVWWCPFHHSHKQNYVPIHNSFWHIDKEDRDKMHPDDRNNPMFTHHPHN